MAKLPDRLWSIEGLQRPKSSIRKASGIAIWNFQLPTIFISPFATRLLAEFFAAAGKSERRQIVSRRWRPKLFSAHSTETLRVAKKKNLSYDIGPYFLKVAIGACARCCQLCSASHEIFSRKRNIECSMTSRKKLLYNKKENYRHWFTCYLLSGVWAGWEKKTFHCFVVAWNGLHMDSFRHQTCKLYSTRTHTSPAPNKLAAVQYGKLHKKHLNARKIFEMRWKAIDRSNDSFFASSNAFSMSSSYFPSIFPDIMRFSSRVLFLLCDWLKFSNHTIHIQAAYNWKLGLQLQWNERREEISTPKSHRWRLWNNQRFSLRYREHNASLMTNREKNVELWQW